MFAGCGSAGPSYDGCPFEPRFKINREIGRTEMIGIDLVISENFRRRRGAKNGDAGGNRLVELMQHVGMADQDGRSGIS
jgi:hypothetical protein